MRAMVGGAARIQRTVVAGRLMTTGPRVRLHSSSHPISPPLVARSAVHPSSGTRRLLHCRATLHSTSPTTTPTAASSSSSPAAPLDTAASSPPLPFAVVGSGPAAFYTCKYLLRELPNIRIDMFERLPVPYGLVRFGVAPDHPDVKSVAHDFEIVSNDSRFAFWGNVLVGGEEGTTATAGQASQQATVSVEELRRHYSGIIFAYGASGERTLSLPGSNLKGIHPSRHFVNWYNAHPDHSSPSDPHNDFGLDRVRTAVIVGQGNVAVDCARVLLSPLKRLQNTDISTQALEKLAASAVRDVHMVGRRGAVQSAFSIGELRELATSVEGLRVCINKDEVKRSENEASMKEIELSRPKKRKHDLLRQVVEGTLASVVHPTGTHPAMRDLHVRYLLNPREFLPNDEDPSRVGAIVLEKTELRGLPEQQEAIGTGELVTIKTELVLTSIGYKSLAIPGLPFDSKRNIVPSVGGRVTSDGGAVETGLYVAGWLKRGPSGIIATNIMDARDTVKAILTDVREGRISNQPPAPTPLDILSPENIAAKRIVSREAWARIDAIEQAKGLEEGKPRVKIASKEELLQAAGFKPTAA